MTAGKGDGDSIDISDCDVSYVRETVGIVRQQRVLEALKEFFCIEFAFSIAYRRSGQARPSQAQPSPAHRPSGDDN